ncbi:hypothetical protein AAZX31_19G080800 [Glycine max]
MMITYQEDKFRQAIFQMDLDKAQGPDGLNSVFHKRCWDVCDKEVFKACTNIVLIPKCDNPSSMKDLQSISLCNVAYRILYST